MKKLNVIPLLMTFGLVSLPCFALESEELADGVVEFHIADGTGNGAWNTQDEMVEVKVGQTLRVFNDDSGNHQLHTSGAPCGHGPLMASGTSWDCVVGKAYDPNVSGALYDHNHGPDAAFWVNATVE